MGNGVTVAQQTLTLFVLVRIQVPQPLKRRRRPVAGIPDIWQARSLARAALTKTRQKAQADQAQPFETAVIEDSSLAAFYRDMNASERRTFWACAAGWALDGMDFMIYPLVIGTSITMWKVDAGYAGLAGTVTSLSSAVGGWLGGYVADRIGRVRTLQFTILWFSFF